jgi:hypothetical protein
MKYSHSKAMAVFYKIVKWVKNGELNPVEQLWQQIKQRFLSNTTFQNYDDIIERSCQAWNEILSEDDFIKNLCSREWSFLV